MIKLLKSTALVDLIRLVESNSKKSIDEVTLEDVIDIAIDYVNGQEPVFNGSREIKHLDVALELCSLLEDIQDPEERLPKDELHLADGLAEQLTEIASRKQKVEIDPDKEYNIVICKSDVYINHDICNVDKMMIVIGDLYLNDVYLTVGKTLYVCGNINGSNDSAICANIEVNTIGDITGVSVSPTMYFIAQNAILEDDLVTNYVHVSKMLAIKGDLNARYDVRCTELKTAGHCVARNIRATQINVSKRLVVMNKILDADIIKGNSIMTGIIPDDSEYYSILWD